MYPYFFIGYETDVASVDVSILDNCLRFNEEDILKPSDKIKLVTLITGRPRNPQEIKGKTADIMQSIPITYKDLRENNFKLPDYNYLSIGIVVGSQPLVEKRDYTFSDNTINFLWTTLKDHHYISIRAAIDVFNFNQIFKGDEY